MMIERNKRVEGLKSCKKNALEWLVVDLDVISTFRNTNPWL